MPSEEMMKRYAQVAVEVGLGVERGDRVLISSPVQLPDFTAILVETAYDSGADSVDVLWSDDRVRRARFSHGSEDAAGVVSGDSQALMASFEAGASYLRILAEDPAGLSGVDMARVQKYQKVNGEYVKPHSLARGALQFPWCVIAAPVPAWTGEVFADQPEGEATENLWNAIFRACRIDREDPVQAWRDHLQDLSQRRDYLTERRFTSLRYEGPGTDLVLGMTDGVKWEGGGVKDADGRPFAPNLPTEEVFTSPHRSKADGRVQATKPLSYFGDQIEDFTLELKDGSVVAAEAAYGQETLERVLETDEGSARFGEAAMVPQSGAVAAEGLVWRNTLYDENDACHIALGQSYPTCYEGAAGLSEDELLDVGLNASTVHVDFVVGSPEVSVYGVRDDGTEEPIISQGEWGFSV